MTREYFIRLIAMLFSVTMMGVCVSILVMTNFGPDPCYAMNYGMARLTGLSFGTYQVIFNIILFMFIFVCDKSLLGIGSFANMIVIGYAADFTTWAMNKFFGITTFEGLLQRVCIMIPTLLVFLVVASVYMNSGLGTSPYDALVYLIHKKLCQKLNKEIPFRVVRMAYDFVVTAFAFLIGGEAGLITVAMVLTLGPSVDFIGRLMNKKRNN